MGALAAEILARGKGSHRKGRLGYRSCNSGVGSCMNRGGPDCDVT